jgi:hypothetical protein
MYWRGIPYFDPDESAWARQIEKQDAGSNAPLAVLAEIAKFLAITAAIYLLLAMTLSVL